MHIFLASFLTQSIHLTQIKRSVAYDKHYRDITCDNTSYVGQSQTSTICSVPGRATARQPSSQCLPCMASLIKRKWNSKHVPPCGRGNLHKVAAPHFFYYIHSSAV